MGHVLFWGWLKISQCWKLKRFAGSTYICDLLSAPDVHVRERWKWNGFFRVWRQNETGLSPTDYHLYLIWTAFIFRRFKRGAALEGFFCITWGPSSLARKTFIYERMIKTNFFFFVQNSGAATEMEIRRHTLTHTRMPIVWKPLFKQTPTCYLLDVFTLQDVSDSFFL